MAKTDMQTTHSWKWIISTHIQHLATYNDASVQAHSVLLMAEKVTGTKDYIEYLNPRPN
jgi:hypothetical protein